MTNKTRYKYWSEALQSYIYVYAYSEEQARALAKARVIKKIGDCGVITLSREEI